MRRIKRWCFVTTVVLAIIAFSLLHDKLQPFRHHDPETKTRESRQLDGVHGVGPRKVFYNRVGKCGSRSLLQIVSMLSKRNKFVKVTSEVKEHDHPELEAVLSEMKKIASFKPRTFYDRHIHFLDFKREGMEEPIYINLIRDPIDRFASQYNYWKYGDGIGVIHPMKLPDINECVARNLSTCHSPTMFYICTYFCGFSTKCLERSSMERVEIAKKHIDENYLIVGILEEFETTLNLLERMLPGYFQGAMRIWRAKQKNIRNWAKTKKLDILTEESKNKLRREYLVHEYKVYNHAKKKFDEIKARFNIT